MQVRGFIVLFFAMQVGIVSGQSRWRESTSEFIFNQPTFKSCHASTLTELAPGKIMAAWFGGDYERARNVEIWISILENGRWSAPRSMADGVMNDTLRYPCWNPVLFRSTAGELFLFYKVGPSPSTWWGMVRSSNDDGKTWTAPKRLPDRILGPIKNKAIQLSDGTILSPSSTEIGTWKVHIERSTDQGKTWEYKPVDHNTKYMVIQPTLFVYPGKKLQMLCRSGNDRIVESWSYNNGDTWSQLALTNLPNPNSGIDGITLKNKSQLLVYNPTKRGNNGRAKLSVATSKDGKNWKNVFVLENQDSGEFSYPAVIQSKDGKVHITYTHNRTNIRYVVLEPAK